MKLSNKLLITGLVFVLTNLQIQAAVTQFRNQPLAQFIAETIIPYRQNVDQNRPGLFTAQGSSDRVLATYASNSNLARSGQNAEVVISLPNDPNGLAAAIKRYYSQIYQSLPTNAYYQTWNGHRYEVYLDQGNQTLWVVIK